MDPQIAAVAAAVAAASLQEALGLLRDQTALLLQRHRDRRDRTAAVDSALLDGQLRSVTVDPAVLEAERPALERLHAELEPAAIGRPADPRHTREAFEDLRAALERVLGQHITFTGEQRPPTGTATAPRPTEGSRVFTVRGNGNVVIGGDHRGSITVRQ